MKLYFAIALFISLAFSISCDDKDSITGYHPDPYFEVDSISAYFYNRYSSQQSDSVSLLGIYYECRFVNRPGSIVQVSYSFLNPYRSPIEYFIMTSPCRWEPSPADTLLIRSGEGSLPLEYFSGVDTLTLLVEYEVEFWDAMMFRDECRKFEYGFYTWADTIYPIHRSEM
jgi:hypothetical protein